MYVLTHAEGQVIGSAELIRETLESLLEEKLGFFVMLQEDDEEKFVIFIHSENDEDLEDKQLNEVESLGLNNWDCTEVLFNILDVSVTPYVKGENETMGGNTYEEI